MKRVWCYKSFDYGLLKVGSKALLPFLVFLVTFLGSGLYYHLQGTAFAFYQIPPAVAILPAILLAFAMAKGTFDQRLQIFVDGVRAPDIILMCVIFLLAGAFGQVAKAVGCTDAIVSFTLTHVPSSWLLPGIFFLASFVSLAIGTSMGVVAALTPMAVGFASQGGLPLSLTVATVIGGAMFGDNLSMISDTTIAATNSQGARPQDKFKLNAKIGLVAALLMMGVLTWIMPSSPVSTPDATYSLLKLVPYPLIVILAFLRLNVFVVLVVGILTTSLIGIFSDGYLIHLLAQDIAKGFASMNDILILSLLVGGLSAFMHAGGGMDYILTKLKSLMPERQKNGRRAQFMIAGLVSVTDICTANNTIAILLSGGIAKQIATDHHIPSYKTACWLSIFSCVFQGILPYSAQILLAASLSGTSPLSLAMQVYYCPLLALVTIGYILWSKR